MKNFSLIAAVILLSAQALPALAADAGLPGATVRSDSGNTAPDRKARHEQWCMANPEKCKEMQARREQCKVDPEKCRAERQAKMKERQARREQMCKENPERCAQAKARMDERSK
jgi:TolA-binding protein